MTNRSKLLAFDCFLVAHEAPPRADHLQRCATAADLDSCNGCDGCDLLRRQGSLDDVRYLDGKMNSIEYLYSLEMSIIRKKRKLEDFRGMFDNTDITMFGAEGRKIMQKEFPSAAQSQVKKLKGSSSSSKTQQVSAVFWIKWWKVWEKE